MCVKLYIGLSIGECILTVKIYFFICGRVRLISLYSSLMKWIKIYVADNEMDAFSLKGLFEAVGLNVKLVPESSGSVIQGPSFHTYSNIPYAVYVMETDKVRAEEALRTVN